LSELNLIEILECSEVIEFLKAMKSVKSGEVLTVFIGEESDPDHLIGEVRKASRNWDFQKHRQGDGSWLVHAKLGR